MSKENNCKECVGNFWNGFDELLRSDEVPRNLKRSFVKA